LYDITKAPQGKNSATTVMSPQKQAYMARDLLTTVEREGVPFRYHPQHPVPSLLAGRVLWSIQDMEQRATCSHALYKAYWVDNVDVSDTERLKQVLQTVQVPWPPQSDLDKAGDALRASTQEAADVGAPGVPYFYVQGEQARPRGFWGQDRMHVLEAYVQAGGYNWSRLVPGSVRWLRLKPQSDGVKRKLTFWFDVASPWAYVAWTQLKHVQRHTGCTIELKPVFLGMLFKEIGVATLPANAMSVNKRKYFFSETKDWVTWWQHYNGESKPEPFVFAGTFPIRTVNAQRIILIDPRTVDCLYRAAWANNQVLGDETVLVSVLDKAGFDGHKLLQGAKDNVNGCRDKLRDNTAEAVRLGLFGVPTYQVDDGELWWGQDKLNIVMDMLNGWKAHRPSKL
jgi:2-hydroxychromene-2-carboxylate isomerase